MILSQKEEETKKELFLELLVQIKESIMDEKLRIRQTSVEMSENMNQIMEDLL